MKRTRSGIVSRRRMNVKESLAVSVSFEHVITRLRKKLGPLGEHVITVWGVGYRFIP